MKRTALRSQVFLAAVLLAAFIGAGIASAQTNTKFGDGALQNNNDTFGTSNSAFGYHALFTNTTGGSNTATGHFALLDNLYGSFNTATGDNALLFNTIGSFNTATGNRALAVSTTGDNNSATGNQALEHNTTGSNNTATGELSLWLNTTGTFSTATGVNALQFNTSGHHNTADGGQALLHNTTGFFNTATGLNALAFNTTGSNNIGLGINAGFNLTTGSNNIDIGSAGVAAESNTIRIGTPGRQTAAFIAGISGSVVTGNPVMVSSTGKLGIVVSSARFKRDIHDMGRSSSGLMKLRPVTFRYRNDPDGIRQYGLVAEEVARVYPELVSYDPDGKVQTVNYLTLTSMLLNELQKQTTQVHKLSAQMAEVRAERDREREQRAAFEARLSALEHTMAAKDRAPKLAAAFVR